MSALMHFEVCPAMTLKPYLTANILPKEASKCTKTKNKIFSKNTMDIVHILIIVGINCCLDNKGPFDGQTLFVSSPLNSNGDKQTDTRNINVVVIPYYIVMC